MIPSDTSAREAHPAPPAERFAVPHGHSFGQHEHKPGEIRTWWVIGLTSATMIVEIVAGLLFGSMALLADGLHMASHAAALGIAAFAYFYARRRARDSRFSFGTGKVNSLAGFASAVILAMFSALMIAESISRFMQPIPIKLDEALVVAVLGLVVNGVSVMILGGRGHGEQHPHDPDSNQQHDHNLRAAYLHVLADALTSLLAIVALLCARFFGLTWMDPLMGIVGGILVARWSWCLIRQSAAVLLDRQASEQIVDAVRSALEEDPGTRVLDLHVWTLGPGYSAVLASVAARNPRPPEHYKRLLPRGIGLAHVSIEVNRR